MHVERISAAFAPSVATTQNSWYDIIMVLDGEHVEVWRDEEQVLRTDSATVLEAGSSLRFEIKPRASREAARSGASRDAVREMESLGGAAHALAEPL